MQHSRKAFSQTDIEQLNKQIRGAWLVHAFILILVLGLGFLMMSSRKYNRDPDTVWLLVGVLAIISSLLLLPRYRRLFRDKRGQTKICGEFMVEKDVEATRYSTRFHFIVAVDGKKHKLTIGKELYDVVLPTMPVSLEFSEHSGTLFRIVQNEMVLSI